MANDWARKVGQMLRNVRPGLSALATSKLDLPRSGLTITCPVFEDGGTIPDRFTQDGEALFPPLEWHGIPPGTRSLALIVEDADAPFPGPLVHAVLHSIPPTLSGIHEGGLGIKQLRASPLGFKVGRNSMARAGWMAPSPIPGHGPHRYAFQLFAADIVPGFLHPPGRGLLLRALKGNILGAARTIGVYQRP